MRKWYRPFNFKVRHQGFKGLLGTRHTITCVSSHPIYLQSFIWIDEFGSAVFSCKFAPHFVSVRIRLRTFIRNALETRFKHHGQGGLKWISIWTLRFMARDRRFRCPKSNKSLMRDSCWSRQSSLEYIYIYFRVFWNVRNKTKIAVGCSGEGRGIEGRKGS